MKLTAEQINKAASCKSVDELMTLARAEGVQLSTAEAEKYFASLANKEINVADLGVIAGGACVGNWCGSNTNPHPGNSTGACDEHSCLSNC